GLPAPDLVEQLSKPRLGVRYLNLLHNFMPGQFDWSIYSPQRPARQATAVVDYSAGRPYSSPALNRAVMPIRRLAFEACGYRPTARCALGRECVFGLASSWGASAGRVSKDRP